MATITTGFMPHLEPDNAQTPGAEYLQTSGSKATAGSIPIFSSATASDDFYLTSLNVSVTDATNTAVFSSYIGKTKIATYPTLGAAGTFQYSHAFPPIGISGVTTTTATVSIVGDGSNTGTVYFFATGWRKK
jgi:hypothetical protein